MSNGNRTYRRIVTTFWTDPDLRRRGITRDQRLLLLYYFTGPRTNLAGLYWLPLTYAAQETDLPLEDVRNWTLGELSPYVTYDPETEEILVHRLAVHNLGEELKPKDHRTQPVSRNLADAHSAELVRRWFELYPTWPIDREKLAPILEPKGATPRGLPKGLTQGATPRGYPKGLGVAIAVAVAEAEAVPEQQQHPPASRSRTARGTTAPPREDGGTSEKSTTNRTETGDALELARRNIVAIHGGTEDDVEILGQRVGIGVEVNAFRALCRKAADPPEIIARAIAYLPEVTGLERPVSLARWAADDGPAVFEQCLAKAYAEASPTVALRLPGPPPPSEDPHLLEAKRKARDQIATLRRTAEA